MLEEKSLTIAPQVHELFSLVVLVMNNYMTESLVLGIIVKSREIEPALFHNVNIRYKS